MIKKTYLLITFISTLSVIAGQISKTEITDEQYRLLILPANMEEDESSVSKEVVSIVSDVCTNLPRFEVIDRNDLEAILGEQALQLSGIINDSLVVEIGNIASAKEALVVKILNFYQQGVPPKDEDEDEDDEDKNIGLLGKIILKIVEEGAKSAFRSKEDKSDEYYYNIQTTLSVQVKKIDIETGKSSGSFTVITGHTGGNKGRSRAVTMLNFQRQTLTKIKQFYTLTSEVISVRGKEVLLFLGSNLGVEKGTMFEIIKPDRLKIIRGKKIVIPGKRIGIVDVMDASKDANRSIILRNWRPIKEGYRALEYRKIPTAFELKYIHNSETTYSGLSLGFLFRPIKPGFGSAILRLASTTDSFNNNDFTLGFGGTGGWRFLRTPLLSFSGLINIDLDIAFRDDDDNHNVTAFILSAAPHIEMEILMSETKDLVFGAGYRFGGISNHWTYTVNPEGDDGNSITKNAVWIGSSPEIDISGLFFTMGIKFISF
ncbi:MAG: hypothetical protein IID16_11465 [Candidatus Marinimicrobia bacterium]|nr:hypothetical protein [Candidatus Neomarinimicrobiota bacterium]